MPTMYGEVATRLTPIGPKNDRDQADSNLVQKYSWVRSSDRYLHRCRAQEPCRHRPRSRNKTTMAAAVTLLAVATWGTATRRITIGPTSDRDKELLTLVPNGRRPLAPLQQLTTLYFRTMTKCDFPWSSGTPWIPTTTVTAITTPTSTSPAPAPAPTPCNHCATALAVSTDKEI